MTAFALPVGDGIDLVLRELRFFDEVHALVAANQAEIGRWEPWAAGDLDVEAGRRFNRQALEGWVDGSQVPCLVRVDGRIVGSLGARIDGYRGVAELGYWLDAGVVGHGVMARACAALIDVVLDTRPDVVRLQIETGARNVRSRALAERLGFTHEGTARSAIRVGAHRQDLAVYAWVRGDPRPWRGSPDV